MKYILWFDSSKSPMPEKAQRAIEYYTKKFGNPPSILETSRQDDSVTGLRVVVHRIRLPKFHFLLGE